MAQGTRGRRGGQGPLPAVGEAGLADVVATLGDRWVLEVFEADAGGDFLFGVVSRSAAAMALEARGREGLFYSPGLHTLCSISSELKALPVAAQTSLHKPSEPFGFGFLSVSQSEAAALSSAAFPSAVTGKETVRRRKWGVIPPSHSMAQGAPYLSGQDLWKGLCLNCCAGPERWEPMRAAMAGSQSGSTDPTARAAPRAGGGAGSLVS